VRDELIGIEKDMANVVRRMFPHLPLHAMIGQKRLSRDIAPDYAQSFLAGREPAAVRAA
jgi:hypothetical protein